MPDSLKELQDRFASFVESRDWGTYHTPQNLSMAISVEANELLENFLWFNNPSSERVLTDDELMKEIEDEMADVLSYSMALANQLDIDLLDAIERKIDQNVQRFDEERSAELVDELKKWQ